MYRRARQLPTQGFQPILGAGDEDDAGLLARQFHGDCAPDPAACSCHQGETIFDL
jgi:hypothetical protein